MKPNNPKIIESLLANSPSLCSIREELTRQEALLKHFKAVLPSSVAPHLLGARIRDNELVLYAENAAWLTRLRYHATQLAASLPRTYPSLKKVRFRLVEAARHPTSVTPARLSAAAGHNIAVSAKAIADQSLRRALLKLAARSKA